MFRSPFEKARRRVGLALVAALGLGIVWTLSPGLPILWGPYASARAKETGKALFEHEWQPGDPLAKGDGLGPVFNARSCVACHFQGGVGGGGDTSHNVAIFEAHPTPRDPEVHGGAIHAFARDPSCRETPDLVRSLFPVIRGETRIVNHCTVKVADFEPLRIESVNTPPLFGIGWIDRISEKAISNNRMKRLLANSARELELDFDAIPVGRPRILEDGRVGKFGWKGQFATLKEFVAEACANELGLSTPMKEKTRPLSGVAVVSDKPDLDRGQFSDLLAYCDTLPRPVQVLPDDPEAKERAIRGKELFGSVGCAACHVPDLGGVKGVYSDFLLYDLETPPPGSVGGDSYTPEVPPEIPPLPRDHPPASSWKTPPLWGVADSAPYFHDGCSRTLKVAILRHRGDATGVTEAYKKLPAPDQEAVIAFLMTLKAPPEAAPVVEDSLPH